MTAEAVESFFTLGPGEHRTASITLSAEQGVPTQRTELTVIFEIIKMDGTAETVVIERTASADVTALFEKDGLKIFGWENNLPSPLNTSWGTFAIVFLVWIGVAALVYFVVTPSIGRLTKRTKNDLDDRLLRLTKMPVLLLITSYGLVDSLDILNIPADLHVQIWQAYRILLALVIAWIAYRIFDSIVIHYAHKWSEKTDSEVDDVLVPLIHKMGLIIIPLVGIGTALSVVGIDLTLVIASFGVMGIVIGLAAQASLGQPFLRHPADAGPPVQGRRCGEAGRRERYAA